MKRTERVIQNAWKAIVVASLGFGCFSQGKPAGTVQVTMPGAITQSDGTIGVRNFEQVREAMEDMTGISTANLLNYSQVVAFVGGARSRLSFNGDARGVSSGMLLTITGLAGTYCHFLMIDGTSPVYAALVSGVNLSVPYAQISTESKSRVAGNFARRFWRREPNAEEIATLVEAMNEAAATSLPSVQAFAIGCTAALSSADFFQS